jgi:hypothetical protein
MAILFNPLYLFVPPALVLISIPLVLFAIFTTLIAFATLFVRVSIVYVELGLALLRSYLLPSSPKPSKPPTPIPASPSSPSRRRRSSVVSTSSSQEYLRKPPGKSDSYVSLLGAGAPNRDYEGVGGWRDLVDDQEESLWLGMNARLELPMSVSNKQRRHTRSLTGGSVGNGSAGAQAMNRYSWSPGAMRMSPVQSRARTPSVPDMSAPQIMQQQVVSSEEYFELQPYGRPVAVVEMTPKDSRRKSGGASGTGSGPGSSDILRRKSLGASSTSSSTSSGRSSKATVKQTAYG